MSGAPLRLLLVFILLLSGLHNAAPAMAGMTHHATDSHLSHHVEPGHASDKDTQKGQQDADLLRQWTQPAQFRPGATRASGGGGSGQGTALIEFFKLAGLFALTAVAEIVGCYLPWLVLKQDRSAWLLVPAALSLAAFAWLLTLHPTAAGRTYAAYGGMYIAVALLWLRIIDGIALTRWDIAGAGVALVGMAIIALQPAASP